MKRYLISLAAVAVVGAIALLALRTGDTSEAAGPPPNVISVFGKVPGTNLAVHIIAVVPAGRSASDVAAEARAAHGAAPFSSADFSLTGLNWDTDSDPTATATVLQSYNPASDPSGGGGTALAATQGTWNGVTGATSQSTTGAPPVAARR